MNLPYEDWATLLHVAKVIRDRLPNVRDFDFPLTGAKMPSFPEGTCFWITYLWYPNQSVVGFTASSPDGKDISRDLPSGIGGQITESLGLQTQYPDDVALWTAFFQECERRGKIEGQLTACVAALRQWAFSSP